MPSIKYGNENLTVSGAEESNASDVRQDFLNLINKKGRSGKEDEELAKLSQILQEMGILTKSLKENAAGDKKAYKEQKEELKKVRESNKDIKKAIEEDNKKLTSMLKSGLKSITGSIDRSIQVYSQNAIRVSAQLQGTTKSYAWTVDKLNQAIGSTGLAKMSDVLSEMSNLTSRGIVANIEQKAFLASIKDGIISTFDVADSTMLRLIKLQGEESTTNRMVMQASLRDYLNSQYQNSQYIYENYKQVSDSLLEATSLLTSSLSLSLESTVQKWMGSLSSVGLSSSAINSLAQAIGYLGSGDLQGMSSSGVQKLVMMGASRAGLSYSDLLTGGVSAENAEALMAGMVRYLSSLSGNNVILSEYAKIFGISVSDIVAAKNAAEELESITGSRIAYTESKLTDYLQKYSETLEDVPSVLYDTLLENMWFGAGLNVASNRGAYGAYKVGGMMADFGETLSGFNNKLASTAGLLLMGTGVASQLFSALGVGGGFGSVGGLAKTVQGLGESIKNLFASPDALAAFNALGYEGKGFNIIGSSIEGGEGVWNPRIPNQSPYITTSGGEYGGSEASGGVVDIDSALAEAESERGANDIYEFLSDDVVTITPYVGDEGNIFNLIAEYNKITATSTAGIWDVVNKIFNTGEIQLQLGNGNTESGPYNQQPGI